MIKWNDIKHGTKVVLNQDIYTIDHGELVNPYGLHTHAEVQRWLKVMFRKGTELEFNKADGLLEHEDGRTINIMNMEERVDREVYLLQ